MGKYLLLRSAFIGGEVIEKGTVVELSNEQVSLLDKTTYTTDTETAIPEVQVSDTSIQDKIVADNLAVIAAQNAAKAKLDAERAGTEVAETETTTTPDTTPQTQPSNVLTPQTTTTQPTPADIADSVDGL